MSNSIKFSHEVQKKTPKKNIPLGRPIYTANTTIGNTIRVEVLYPAGPGQTHEFPNHEDGIEDFCYFLIRELVKGVRLTGNKRNCSILAEKLVRQGIKPLITNKKPYFGKKLEGMPILNDHVAGVDIGKSMIMVAVPPSFAEDHTRAFGTNTEDLEAIVEWLKELKIEKVAMESTSVYWIPLYDLLQLHKLEPLIINPKRVKMFPGRKSDVLDSQWLMRLLACGLLDAGFLPPLEMRALRDLARYRQDLMDRAGDSLNRMHKVLSVMNIQLGNVISDISGKSGTEIIRAIVNGECNAQILAALADRRCKKSPKEIAKALHGIFKREQVFMLKKEMNMYDHIHNMITDTEMEIKELLENLPDVPNLPPLPLRDKKHRTKREYDRSPYCFDMRTLLYQKFGKDLTRISGIEEGSAAVVLFETGGKVDAFPTDKHFASYSGLAPGTKISGGRTLSGKSPKKFSRVGQVCRIAAHANSKSNSFIGAHLRRYIRNGKTKKTARKATAHKINTMIYRMLKYDEEYVEKGAEACEKAYEERKINSCIRTLENMGYDCSKLVKKEEVA
jgi:transposase